jgi:hypothetical protein
MLAPNIRAVVNLSGQVEVDGSTGLGTRPLHCGWGAFSADPMELRFFLSMITSSFARA